MGNRYTSNEFLFSFEGRINRAKYWYAVFASSAFCGVLLGVLAFALGRIFAVSIKSIHLNFFDIAAFNITFSEAGPAPTETQTLFYAGGAPIVAFGMWFLAATTVKRLHDRNKSGWWIVPLFIAPSIFTDLKVSFPIAMRCPSWGSSHSFFGSRALSSCSAGEEPPGPTGSGPTRWRPSTGGRAGTKIVPHRSGPNASTLEGTTDA